MGEILDRSPLSFISGQQQRLAVASILALQPQGYHFDESTLQLDPIGRDEIFQSGGGALPAKQNGLHGGSQYRENSDVSKVVVPHEGELAAMRAAYRVWKQKIPFKTSIFLYVYRG